MSLAAITAEPVVPVPHARSVFLPTEPAGTVIPMPKHRKDWRDYAACTDKPAEMFFPGKGQPTKPARQVCASCDVREQCLQWALENDEQFGIWGGTSQQERRRLQRKSQQSRPQNDKRRTGRAPNPEITKRNEEICQARANKIGVEELSVKYSLSVNTIYRISGRVRRTKTEAQENQA
ncbi:MAG: hypothetical protein B5766_05470 [Candidatus Lumbricidophila eiseniae]|uniref:Transcriptional regulator WhiB n=1 Tax=Candidatus Lumbricidiphila eiseniae TaxID=1969409 RepID=A0A2A6FRJ9_9MICO|nr:MAG: hypothetical protein B5766_05470 [Candidatus Lumbricidophila eiseniae]